MRERIIAVAIEIIEEFGIKFTMNDLATRLAVSKRTLYEHFHSKEELISVITDSLLDEIDQKIKEIINNGSLSLSEKIKSIPLIYPMKFGPYNRLLSNIRHYMPEEWTKIDHLLKATWRLFEDEVLRKAIAANYFRPVNLAVIQMMFDGIVDQLFNYKLLAQNNLTLNDALTAMIDILLYGLVVPAERMEIELNL